MRKLANKKGSSIYFKAKVSLTGKRKPLRRVGVGGGADLTGYKKQVEKIVFHDSSMTISRLYWKH